MAEEERPIGAGQGSAGIGQDNERPEQGRANHRAQEGEEEQAHQQGGQDDAEELADPVGQGIVGFRLGPGAEAIGQGIEGDGHHGEPRCLVATFVIAQAVGLVPDHSMLPELPVDGNRPILDDRLGQVEAGDLIGIFDVAVILKEVDILNEDQAA